MSAKLPTVSTSGHESSGSSDHDSVRTKGENDGVARRDAAETLDLGLAIHQTQRMESVLGDAVLRLLRIRKGPRTQEYDHDAVCISISSAV
jgi:hypothetical protein